MNHARVSSFDPARLSRHIRRSLAHRGERVGPFLAAVDPVSANPGRNYAVPDDGAEPTGTDVAALVAYFERHDRLPRLEYVPVVAPAVETALSAAGFIVEGRPPVMVSTPELTLVPRDPDAVRLALATSEDDLWAAARVQHHAYGATEEPGPHDVARLRSLLDRGGVVAVARSAATGAAVGSGLVDRIAPDDGVGELAAVGVLAEYRRRGIASAVSVFLARAAHVCGMPLVWLEAAVDEEEIYRRAGFVEVGRKLWISRP